MRQSPRRPLILRRRKLPFQQNDPPAAKPQSQTDTSASEKPPKPDATSQSFPDGVRIMDHPSMSDTQVVVIPHDHILIGALTAKAKECGVQGPNKFIPLSENGSIDDGSVSQPAAGGDDVSTVRQPKAETVPSTLDVKPLTGIRALNKELECGPLDDSLTNIQWLGRVNTFAEEKDPAKQTVNKENQTPNSQTIQMDADAVQQPMSERPPYSYMAMIQFAINSRKSRRMMLKEIYMWIEDHFPYFREVAKPGWKNSIRHNLSLHDMFIREMQQDDKASFWTIRPEANRCLTLDRVYKPGCDPMTAPVPVPMLLFPHQRQKRMLPDARKIPTSSGRRMKPLLPRTDSYFVPIQLPVASSIYLPTTSTPIPPSCSQQKRWSTSRGTKRVRIAPKVTQSDVPAVNMYPQKDKAVKVEVKEEPVCVPVTRETPKAPIKKQASSSRRKQRLVHSLHEEPVLFCPNNTFFASGELEEQQQAEQHSPDRDFSFKTPIKSSSHLTSSTPSKPPSHLLPEPWKVTPVGKGSQSDLDFSPIHTPSGPMVTPRHDYTTFSPIHTPGGPMVTPRHDYTTFSLNSSHFADWPLFNSPRELLNWAPSRATGSNDSTVEFRGRSCSRELLQAGGAATPANRSFTEGLVLDTMNESLSKILGDISFSGLEDEDMGIANISWSELFSQFK